MGEVRVSNVVFDMGGVLLKWQPLAYARRVCADEDDAALLACEVFGSVAWTWNDAGAVDAATVAWVAKEQLPARLHGCVDELAHHWYERREMVEGMDELIRDLKRAGMGIYLLSNAGEQFASYQHDLPGYDCFDGMVVSCYEHLVKPDARLYEILLERYGLDPARCLFVDDTQLNVIGARRVGMQGWHFDGDVAALRRRLLGNG